MARHEPATEGTRVCKRCGEEKHVTEYRIDRSMVGGRGNTCKACFNASQSGELRRAQSRAWYHRKKADPAWVEKERRRSREKNRRARAALPPEVVRERDREEIRRWRKANPDRSYEYGRRSKLKHRVIKAGGVFVEHVEPLVLLEMDDGVCGVCGEDVNPFDFDMDHVIPASKGGEHSYANMQIAHPACNQRKSNRLPEEIAA